MDKVKFYHSDLKARGYVKNRKDQHEKIKAGIWDDFQGGE